MESACREGNLAYHSRRRVAFRNSHCALLLVIATAAAAWPQQSPVPRDPRNQGPGLGGNPPVRVMTPQRAPVSSPETRTPPPAGNPAPVSAPQPQPPPPPPRGAELLPSQPPRISFAGGELTIVANNSSLADILKSVERTLGATLEGSSPDSERVFGQFGPGNPREVIDALLDGSRYDFILVSPLEDPSRVQRILLSHHGASAATMATGSNQPNRAPVQTVEEEPETPTEPPTQPQPVPPPTVEQQTVVPPPGTMPPTGQAPPNGNTPQVKTPEQLLQELQRMRQLQQQQQQQQQNDNPH
jgi:hypothetical protein